MNGKTMDAFLDAAGAVDDASARVALVLKEHDVPLALSAAGIQARAHLTSAADTFRSIAALACKLEQLAMYERGQLVPRKPGSE